MSDPKNYTVGWICAVTTEYVAARAFLDEVHDEPGNDSGHDNNVYTLGKVGKHNVVIAVLPEGEYGTASAARVASDMLHRFPNVRIGLMVGIGGGAPSKDHDIRLGDVVVSSPRDGNSGVFQYDFGKTIQNQSFCHTRFLNQPPTVLRTALSGLKVQYEERGNQIEEAINTILEKKPRLRQKYKRPDPSRDRLYRAEFNHRSSHKDSCKEVCGDDLSTLIIRRERNEMEDNPAIHYGLIASGDQLMFDALVRDTLAKEKNVLCFEMEAAGLMNHFPCLVIRGICDYSDTHANKEWQGYAALTAAAYAKDLLCQISPSRVEAERRISDILASVEKEVNEMRGNVHHTMNAIKDLGFEQKREKTERWLSPPDPSTNYNRALEQRQEGTGLWFLQCDQFARWKTERNSFLWLYGIPGCGKTILSSTIIAHLSSTLLCQPLLYFYFDFTDTGKQTLESVIRSLISQLYSTSTDAWKELDSLFSSCEDGHRQPNCESLCKTFLHMMEQVKEAWIVLDALDECHTRKKSATEGIFSWIRDLLNSKQKNIHLLVTSRPEQDIKAQIEEFAHGDKIIPIQGSLINDDICAYIRTRVKEHDGLKRWRSQPEIQEQIETQLREKANGMFRWAACQLDALENCRNYRSLQQALASLPKDLDETYGRILNSIPDDDKPSAIRILQLLIYSERPLTIKEAVDAIAVQTEGDQYFDERDRLPDPSEISCYCSSLVVVVHSTEDSSHDDDTLQLAHFSIKEYLTSDRLDENFVQQFQEVAARASIATICLGYLLHVDIELAIPEIKENFPFAKYSATYWMSNAAVAEGQNLKLQDFITKFLCKHKNSYRNCYSLYKPDQPLYSGEGEPASALYYMSFGGLIETVKYLLIHSANVNTQGGKYGSALQAASYGGHEKIVELLLTYGADVNASGNERFGDFGSALEAASSKGHEKIVKLLLNHGADVNAQGGRAFGSALEAASFQGHERIIEQLLSHGPDINIQGGYFGTALGAAVYRGHERIIELLLTRGANINIQGGFYGTALGAASYQGYEKIVELLLSHGADINVQSGNYGTALGAASYQGHEKIVELLLSYGADVNTEGRDLDTVLGTASLRGHEKIVKLLLHHGADVNVQGGNYGSALGAASFRGEEKIVRLLLSHDADINIQGGRYGTALGAASYQGHEKIVELLLNHGADTNIQGEYYGPPLLAASYQGHEKIVELLLNYGADVNAQRGEGIGSALEAALYQGHEKIVELLLNRGAKTV